MATDSIVTMTIAQAENAYLAGVKIDNSCFYDGGSIFMAFVMPNEKDYWPKPGSVLISNANPDFAPELDFNNTIRKSPFDVGAYESERHAKNPGWRGQI